MGKGGVLYVQLLRSLPTLEWYIRIDILSNIESSHFCRGSTVWEACTGYAGSAASINGPPQRIALCNEHLFNSFHFRENMKPPASSVSRIEDCFALATSKVFSL